MTTVLVDATDVFDSSASETRVKQAVESAFPCELIKRTGDEYDPIDFDWLDLFGDLVAHVELKSRRYASNSVIAKKGPVIGLRKFTALRREEARTGVPSFLLVEWADGVVEFAPLSAVAREGSGHVAVLPNLRRDRRPGRRSDIEGQVFFPAEAMTRLDASTTRWPFDPPALVPAQRSLASVAA